MRFIIFSDSHGSQAKMYKALKTNISAGLEGMIFLGDGLKDAVQVAGATGVKLFSVAGNCDFGVDMTKKSTYEQLYDFDGKKVLIMHGHRYSVKSGIEAAADYARAKSADVLLFGHTHNRIETYLPPCDGKKALYLFNPGSITLPNDGICSFGLMEIRKDGILLSHGTV